MSCLLIAGLGNPGVKYQQTRHNVGFMVLDFLFHTLSSESSFKITQDFNFDKKFNAQIASFSTPKHKIYLLKPQTFMNLSGESIAPFVRYFDITEMLVVHDELDIPFGDIRFKLGGSSGGHNGLKSIDTHCGSEYLRLRFGIGREVGRDVASYVLSDFPTSQNKELKKLLEFSAQAALCFAKEFGAVDSVGSTAPTSLAPTKAILTRLQNQFSLKAKKQEREVQNLAHAQSPHASQKPLDSEKLKAHNAQSGDKPIRERGQEREGKSEERGL